MATLKKYQSQIKTALERSNTYYSGLDTQIETLATALKTLELATREISKLDSVTILEKTRYGEKLAPHPAFKIQKDAQDSITRQLKVLGLIGERSDSNESESLIERLMRDQDEDFALEEIKRRRKERGESVDDIEELKKMPSW